MRTFKSVNQALLNIKIELEEFGTKDHSTTVNGKIHNRPMTYLNGYHFMLTDWEDRDETLQLAGYNLTFAEQDVQDRLSPVPLNPGKAVEFDNSGVLKEHLLADGTLDYTYSERMCSQLDKIQALLRERPDTRQAYMSIWDRELDKDKVGSGRVPCSLGFYFYIDHGKLCMIYLMRSLNINGCIGNDIYTATRMIEIFAKECDLEPGYLQMFICNLHSIEKED